MVTDSVHIFIDEVGTVSNATVQGDYGFGWTICRTRDISSIEDLLSKNDLSQIHLRTLPIPDKIAISKKIGSVDFGQFGLIGGAFIRKDPDFSAKIVEDNYNKIAIERPELLLNRQKPKSEDKNKAILTPKELIPEDYQEQLRVIRIQELAVLATRYSLFMAINQFGTNDINFTISAAIGAQDHGDAINRIRKTFANGLQDLIVFMRQINLLRSDEVLESKVFNFNVTQKANGLLGVADFFAGIGYFLASNDKAKNSLGQQMYNEVKHLVPTKAILRNDINNQSCTEIQNGMFVRRKTD